MTPVDKLKQVLARTTLDSLNQVDGTNIISINRYYREHLSEDFSDSVILTPSMRGEITSAANEAKDLLAKLKARTLPTINPNKPDAKTTYAIFFTKNNHSAESEEIATKPARTSSDMYHTINKSFSQLPFTINETYEEENSQPSIITEDANELKLKRRNLTLAQAKHINAIKIARHTDWIQIFIGVSGSLFGTLAAFFWIALHLTMLSGWAVVGLAVFCFAFAGLVAKLTHSLNNHQEKKILKKLFRAESALLNTLGKKAKKLEKLAEDVEQAENWLRQLLTEHPDVINDASLDSKTTIEKIIFFINAIKTNPDIAVPQHIQILCNGINSKIYTRPEPTRTERFLNFLTSNRFRTPLLAFLTIVSALVGTYWTLTSIYQPFSVAIIAFPYAPIIAVVVAVGIGLFVACMQYRAMLKLDKAKKFVKNREKEDASVKSMNGNLDVIKNLIKVSKVGSNAVARPRGRSKGVDALLDLFGSADVKFNAGANGDNIGFSPITAKNNGKVVVNASSKNVRRSLFQDPNGNSHLTGSKDFTEDDDLYGTSTEGEGDEAKKDSTSTPPPPNKIPTPLI